MKLWEHTGAELQAMPVDALAMLVLEAFGPAGWNVIHSSRAQLPISRVSTRSKASRRKLQMHGAWLEAHALVGPHPTQSSSPNARRMTQAGREALQSGLSRLKAGQRLDVDLHPLLAWTVRRQFLMGEFELAAFAAFKEVEVRVRHLGDFSDEQVGVGLMAAAFNPKAPGPLADRNSERGEQEAMMALYRGAIGVFMNPSSHRSVDYDDPVPAAEVVLLADLLMRLLDRVQARAMSTPS